MQNYLRSEIILVRYPFSDLSGAKLRPAIVMNAPHISQDVFILPLTSKITNLLMGEFVLKDWKTEGLNVETAVKRGIYTLQQNLIIQTIGRLSATDLKEADKALRIWLGL